MSSTIKVNEDQPIDSVVGDLIETVARKGRGFVLDLAEKAVADGAGGTGLTIEVKESLRPHDGWRPPADYRAHQIEDTDSFIRYALRYGDKDQSLVFVSAARCVLVINEQVDLGRRETVTMNLPLSQDWTDWSTMIGGDGIEHRELLQFLLSHENNLVDPTILTSMASVKAKMTVNYESDLSDDGRSVGVMFKSERGDELRKFPKTFKIALPVLEADEADGYTVPVELRLEVTMPEGPNEKPSFTLYCSQWQSVYKARLREEATTIADALTGWTVVQGVYGTSPHELSVTGK